MDMEINIEDVEAFVTNADFHRYLLDNTADFAVAAFILQTLLDTVDQLKTQVDNPS